MKKNEFPNELKAADITPTLIKQVPSNKENYRPVGVLPKMSKIFEGILFDQLTKSENKLWQKGMALNMHLQFTSNVTKVS